MEYGVFNLYIALNLNFINIRFIFLILKLTKKCISYFYALFWDFSLSQLFGQKLKQDEVDNFTKKSIKATCIIKIFIPSWKMTVCCK